MLVNTELALCFGKGHWAESSYLNRCENKASLDTRNRKQILSLWGNVAKQVFNASIKERNSTGDDKLPKASISAPTSVKAIFHLAEFSTQSDIFFCLKDSFGGE